MGLDKLIFSRDTVGEYMAVLDWGGGDDDYVDRGFEIREGEDGVAYPCADGETPDGKVYSVINERVVICDMYKLKEI